MNPRFKRFLSVAEERPDKYPYRYKILVAEVRWDGPGGVKSLRIPGIVFAGSRP
jgi:hypothetical protein